MPPIDSLGAPGGDSTGVHAVQKRPEGVQAAPGRLAHRLPLLGPVAVARDEAAAYLGVPLIGVDVDGEELESAGAVDAVELLEPGDLLARHLRHLRLVAVEGGGGLGEGAALGEV